MSIHAPNPSAAAADRSEDAPAAPALAYGRAPPCGAIDLSVVAPAHNEEDNVEPLVEQVEAALSALPGLRFEMIVIDDGSTDGTLERLRRAARRRPWLRVIKMADTPAGRGHGQSAAFKAGFAAARGRLIAVMDADLQNDPADLPALLRALEEHDADLVQGDRSSCRRDNLGRRIGSWVGRTARGWLLGDTIRDTGCSLRVMKREISLGVPLEFQGMHRFIPVTARHLGYRVVEVSVNHRPRVAGAAKYGVFNRAIPGLLDCLAVRWMFRRRRPTHAHEIAVTIEEQRVITSTTISDERGVGAIATTTMTSATRHVKTETLGA